MGLEAASFLKQHHATQPARPMLDASSLAPYLPLQLIKVARLHHLLYTSPRSAPLLEPHTQPGGVGCCCLGGVGREAGDDGQDLQLVGRGLP